MTKPVLSNRRASTWSTKGFAFNLPGMTAQHNEHQNGLAYHGDVRLENQPGRGSHFYAELSRVQAAESSSRSYRAVG